ncbi:MAG: hypothetical protein WCR27_05715 [Eubacteriales bacterium]
MNTKRHPSSNIWLTLGKIVIFLLALYLAYLVLRPLLGLLLNLSFWLIKVIIFITVGFIVVHLFAKIIFDIDLFKLIIGRNQR